jgi:hypothetical protein
MNKILESLRPFCSVKNAGPAYLNGAEPTPRVRFIIDLLDEMKIPYEIDSFLFNDINLYNVILRGTSKRMVVAHHDIVNPDSENANDNSASVLNAIYLKSILPEINVVLTDAEEVGLRGASHLAEQILAGEFGEIEWVLNLELSGAGGKNFMIGSHKGKLTDRIVEMFNAPVVQTPPSDSYAFERYGIDTNVINPLSLLNDGESSILSESGYLDNSSWWLCHTMEDTADKLSTKDMYDFVNEVLVPIVSE